MVFRARGQSSLGRIRAVPANSGPVILPLMVQGAIRTCGLLRMRSGVTSRHHVQLAILFSKPDRRVHNRAVLLKGTERNVLLTMNLVWDRHEKHCTQTNTAS